MTVMPGDQQRMRLIALAQRFDQLLKVAIVVRLLDGQLQALGQRGQGQARAGTLSGIAGRDQALGRKCFARQFQRGEIVGIGNRALLASSIESSAYIRLFRMTNDQHGDIAQSRRNGVLRETQRQHRNSERYRD
ncbi:hypothetical protein AB0N46_19690 [Streptomyces albidoflavus]|uniref:hypothetical protein n=1 Tax=Streptomyces albidoflavus TaxID=1886 RepID=UPI003425B3D2